MSVSGAEYTRRIKQQIDEVDPSEVHELVNNGVAIVDVRETEEYSVGHLPGAKHVPRGYLESRIEGAVPDRSQRVILYCASGNRSALAAHTLTEDLDLSLRAQLKGWKFVFLPWVVTPAELPVDMNGFKSQQHRWVKGSMQTSKKLLGDVLQARIPLHVKTEAALHLTGNTAYILTLLLTLMLFPVTYFRPKLDMKTSVLLDLAVFALATLSVCVFYLA